MQLVDYVTVHSEAAREFDEHEKSDDGKRMTRSLTEGLTNLRDLMFKRVHEDVQTFVGSDSMIMPLSVIESEKLAKVEIELYQIVEATIFAKSREMIDDESWFCDWLTRLRLGDGAENDHVQHRVKALHDKDPDERRISFSRALQKTFPEATRAPLILFRLYPLAIGIVTAVAFNRGLDAAELRNRQVVWQPAIEDCQQCHGRPLDNGERCSSCGNPIWTYKWLQSTE